MPSRADAAAVIFGEGCFATRKSRVADPTKSMSPVAAADSIFGGRLGNSANTARSNSRSLGSACPAPPVASVGGLVRLRVARVERVHLDPAALVDGQPTVLIPMREHVE